MKTKKEYRIEDCPANFRDADGAPYLVRCPKCKLENYSMAVSAGVCAWCGWTEKKEEKTS